MEDSMNHIGREGLEAKFREWGIVVKTTEHPEVYTVEQALPYLSHLEGVFAKNLFLHDKKKKLYLFCAPHNVDIKLNDLAKLVGASGGLRFTDENILQEKLGVKQGAVTVLGLINDTNHDVKLIVDRRLTDGTYSKLYFHPMVNSASCSISPADLNTFLEHTGHEPLLVDIPALR